MRVKHLFKIQKIMIGTRFDSLWRIFWELDLFYSESNFNSSRRFAKFISAYSELFQRVFFLFQSKKPIFVHFLEPKIVNHTSLSYFWDENTLFTNESSYESLQKWISYEKWKKYTEKQPWRFINKFCETSTMLLKFDAE